MNISIQKILNTKTLIPLNANIQSNIDFEIKHIIVYEGSSTPLQTDSIIFFSCEHSKTISFDLITTLHNMESSVLLYGDDPYLPTLKDQLKDSKINVFVLPMGVSFSQFIDACLSIVEEENTALAKDTFESMQTFFECMMKHRNESEVFMDTALDLLGCPLAYANSDFTLQKNPVIPKNFYIQIPFCTDSGTFDWDKALSNFKFDSAKKNPRLTTGVNGSQIGGFTHTNGYLKDQNRHLLIFPVEDQFVHYGYILAAPSNNVPVLSRKQSIVIQQLQVVMKLEVSKSDEIAQTINRYYDFILDELLTSDQTNFEELILKYGLVKKQIFENYYVMVCGKKPINDTGYIFREFLTSQRFNNIYSELCSSFKSVQFFMFEKPESIILLVPETIISDYNGFKPSIESLKESLKGQYDGVGISTLISKNAIRQGYFQAIKALALSRNSKEHNAIYYSELGVLKYFFDNSNNLDISPLMQNYREYIQPISEYDVKHGTELLETLETYIRCCSATSAICESLFIHKNTLYSRMSKISQLIKHDLSDSDTLFNINLALKVKMLIDSGILKI